MKPASASVRRRSATAAETARSLGVSVRALRLYESRGLISPLRTSAGWRVYGPEDVTRLHQITALKRLGLSLRHIARLMQDGEVDLERLLALQEKALEAELARTEGALALVRQARARLARGESLPTDHLVKLIKETAMSQFQWTEDHEALARQHFTPEQIAELRARKFDASDQARTKAVWDELIAEAERLRATRPADCAEAIDLARRWQAEVGKFTGGDPGLNRASAEMYRDAFDDPDKRGLMPFSREVWDYVAAAARAAGERG